MNWSYVQVHQHFRCVTHETPVAQDFADLIAYIRKTHDAD